MTAREFDCLRDVDLFADLSRAELDDLDRQLLSRAYEAGEAIVGQGQRLQALFVVRKGRVRVFRRSEHGRELTIAILGQGTIFGEMSLLGQYMGDNAAEALEASEICMIDTDRVRRLLIADPRIALRIVTLLSVQVDRLETRLADTSFRPLGTRIVTTMLAAGERRRNGRVVVRLTHLQLADLLGVTRETVSRTLGDLTDRGLVLPGRGRVVIPDAVRLRAYARTLDDDRDT